MVDIIGGIVDGIVDGVVERVGIIIKGIGIIIKGIVVVERVAIFPDARLLHFYFFRRVVDSIQRISYGCEGVPEADEERGHHYLAAVLAGAYCRFARNSFPPQIRMLAT